ncbi:uncharacterized protein [Euphorbia lathyris]|uniref:uncharacterized protein n=1 Tax=Euphorbia lathyris TaxID=212925 RepID=UPI003313A373
MGKRSSSKNGGGRLEVEDNEKITTSGTGCMCSVFQLFDFHHLKFPNSHQHYPSESSPPENPPPEAPRNSLELEHPPSPKSSKPDEDECLHIPMGIQIKTNGSSSSEISSSPSTKTPNLVARLMGLDILPDQCHSPTSTLTTPKKSNLNHNRCGGRRQSFHSKRNDYSGTRSLPETPRMSSARKSDVEHRLSLQINKENMSPSEELVLSRFSKRRELRISNEDQENRSPGHYARQIVKQVKESVTRRVGLDITNTVKTRDQEILSQFKNKKTMEDADYLSPGKASCSPRLKFLEPKNNMKTPVVNIMPQKTREYYGRRHQQLNRPKAAVKEERFGPPPPPRLKKKPPQNKKEDAFVHTPTATRANIPDKKFKKSPLSNDLQNITVPTLLPVKKDPIPPATKIPQKQVMPNLAQESKRSSQLSSCSSHSYKQQEITTPDPRGKSNGTFTITTFTGDNREIAAEFEYIARILKRTGIEKETPVSFTRWFSPSHPIDPSIFHYLECFSSQLLSHRCNRKLIFHLVDEILAEILKPYMNIKPWVNSSISNLKGSDLIDVLCSKVRSFPCADCRVLEDIDALIEKDMPPAVKVQSETAFGEEGEGIVIEVEKDLLDTLVHETAALLFYGK